MKKKYINPELIIVSIQQQQLLLGSNIGLGDPGSANDAESRRHRRGRNEWDDEEEDEEDFY